MTVCFNVTCYTILSEALGHSDCIYIMASSVSIITAFTAAVQDVETESRILKQAVEMRSLVQNPSREVSSRLSEMTNAITQIEQKLDDLSSFIEAEMSNLEAFSELHEQSLRQRDMLLSARDSITTIH